MCPTIQAEEVYDLYGKPYSGLRPGVRESFVWAYFFDPEDEDNSLYIHGGVSPDGHGMDYNGFVWYHRLHKMETEWKIIEPVGGSLIPPMRAGAAGSMFANVETVFQRENDTTFMVKNFVTFGGESCQTQSLSSDTWILGEFRIYAFKEESNDDPAEYTKQQQWKWLLASETGSVPDNRRDAVLVYLPDSSDDENGHEFLLLGGDDGQGTLQETYIGSIVRVTATPTDTPTGATPTPTPTPLPGEIGGNPWLAEFEYEVNWTEASPPPADVGLLGHAAVYDPFYGDNPRILVYGGINTNGGLSTVIHEFDLEDGLWATWSPAPTLTPSPTNTPVPTPEQGTPAFTPTPTMTPPRTPVPRCFHAMALDIREHRLLIHGGNEDVNFEEADALDDLWEYDIINQIWTPLSTTESVTRWKHAGCYYWFTLFGGEDEFGNFYDDILEYKPAESGKVWDIQKTNDYGLDDPNRVFNNQRIKPNDTVQIHQTQSTWPGDAYDVKLYIRSYIQNLSIIGVNKDENRPVLWNRYAPIPTPIVLKPLDMDLKTPAGFDEFKAFSAAENFVITDNAGAYYNNLIIGHYLEGESPVAELPEEILEYYADVTCTGPSTPRKAYGIHMLDPGIILTGPVRIENCEFIANGVGCVMICASSAGKFTSSVSNSIFSNNFTGIVQLETMHSVNNNIFVNNALCGICLDKGAHGIIHDNLFVDNGFENDGIYDEWLSGIFSCYSINYHVPSVQQPFIYNNTFVDNYQAVSIWEDGDIQQYVNSPCFFNNILYHSGTNSEPAVKRVNNNRCRLLSFSNCLYGYDELFEHDMMKLLSAWDFSDDPDFESGSEYRLNNDPASPCLNKGFHTLFPGVTDMNEIQDFSFVDIGYHFTDVAPALDPPENLADDGFDLTWDTLSGATGYVVYWEDYYGILQGLELTDDEEFFVGDDYRDVGFWFGVCGYTSNGEFGESAFIEL